MKGLRLLALLATDPFAIPEDPYSVVGITDTEVVRHEKVVERKTCREEASEIRKLRQKLEVRVVKGGEFKATKQCKNLHMLRLSEGKKFWFSKKKAEELKNRAQAAFNAQGIQVSWKRHHDGDDYTFEGLYKHKNDDDGCMLCTYHPKNEQRLPGDTVKKICRCMGHKAPESAHTEKYKEAKKSLEAAEKDVANFPHNVYMYETQHDRFKIYKEWKHPDWPAEGPNVHRCNNYIIDEVIVRAPRISEKWVDMGRSEDVRAMEADARCNLVRVENGAGSKERTINEVKVIRDVWERDLVFACMPVKSPCAEYRNQGGVLISKKPIEDDGGAIVGWEKVYEFTTDPGGVSYRHTYKGPKIWGINGEFDHEIPKTVNKSSLPEVLAAFGAIGDMYRPLEDAQGPKAEDFTDEEKKAAPVFPGEVEKCRCKFSGDAFLDCCKLDGLDKRCSSQEEALAESRLEERCHYVGDRQEADGSTARVYCCFATKIARLLQEQAREKLRLSWGDAENPDCQALPFEEFSKLSGKLDLSEASEDFEPQCKEWEEKMEKTVMKKLEEMGRGHGP